MLFIRRKLPFCSSNTILDEQKQERICSSKKSKNESICKGKRNEEKNIRHFNTCLRAYGIRGDNYLGRNAKAG